MKENKVETNELVKSTNKLKNIIIWAGFFLLAALVGLTLAGAFSPPITDPLARFVSNKQCSFLVMDNVSKAICTDGTVYDVVQIGNPSPLP